MQPGCWLGVILDRKSKRKEQGKRHRPSQESKRERERKKDRARKGNKIKVGKRLNREGHTGRNGLEMDSEASGLTAETLEAEQREQLIEWEGWIALG